VKQQNIDIYLRLDDGNSRLFIIGPGFEQKVKVGDTISISLESSKTGGIEVKKFEIIDIPLGGNTYVKDVSK